MSTQTVHTRLQQINDKIKQAEAEKEACLNQYYEGLTSKLKLMDAHLLPSDVLIGALLDAQQKYARHDPMIEKWQGMAHPFFRPKRPKAAQNKRKSTQGNPAQPHSSKDAAPKDQTKHE